MIAVLVSYAIQVTVHFVALCAGKGKEPPPCVYCQLGTAKGFGHTVFRFNFSFTSNKDKNGFGYVCFFFSFQILLFGTQVLHWILFGKDVTARA